MPYHAMPCHAIPYHTIPYMQYITLHCNTWHDITLHTIHLGNPTCQWRSVVSGTDGQPRWPAPRSSGIQFWGWWNPFHLPSGKIAIEHGPVEISLIFPLAWCIFPVRFLRLFTRGYILIFPGFSYGFSYGFPMKTIPEDVVEQEEPGRFLEKLQHDWHDSDEFKLQCDGEILYICNLV